VGLELPGALTEPLSWIGLTWPEADEELLFQAGQQWIEYGGQLQQISQRANTSASSVWTANEGETADAFERWWTKDDGPQLRLAEDAIAAEVIGGALIVFAVVTLAMKIAFIVQLMILAIEVAQAIATAFVTFGASTAEVPGFIAATRVICRQIIKKVLTHIQTVIKDILKKAKGLLKKVESKLAKRAERRNADQMGKGALWRDPATNLQAPRRTPDSHLASGDPVYYGNGRTAVGYDSATMSNLDSMTRAPGYHDVVVHGRQDGLMYPGRVDAGGANLNGSATHPAQIADAVRNNPGYGGGPVRLISCHSGRAVSGGTPAAQEVADRLGVNVLAPTTRVGRSAAGEPTLFGNGKWRTFSPRRP